MDRDRTMMSRQELQTEQQRSLNSIRLLERQITARKPKIEKAATDLAEAKKEALRKIEETHTKKVGTIATECREYERQLGLQKQRYAELSRDILTAKDEPKPQTRVEVKGVSG